MRYGLAIFATAFGVLWVADRNHETPAMSELPPAHVAKAMQRGYNCWLEKDYSIKNGHYYVAKSEWLCK